MKNSIQILFLVLYSFNISAQTDNIFNAEQLNSEKGVPWGEYQYLSEKIKNAQASTVRITASTAVMISPTHAITAAHSPLDENNEITPDLKVQNIFGEVRNITNVIYDLPSDFAIVELESPFDNSFSVKIAEFDSSSGDPVFSIGNPKDTAWGGVGWAVSFGFARDILFELYFKLFDIQIMGGFSGGGVYNDQGHLVGINSGTTSHMSEGSFRPKMKNFTGIFDEDFSILDGPWKSLNNFQVTAISLSFIKEFMSSHNINNEVSNLNIDLPENKIDNYFDSLTDEEENEMQSMSKSVRESVVAISVGYSLSSGFYPNGSGVLLTPRIVATNSHVVEGKETFIITLHDGSEINGSVLDHHGEMDVSLILLDSPVTSIEPVKIASSRSKLGDKGFVIGHPFDLWSQNGGWQVASAISGYKTTQIDDRGDVLLEGGAQSGMSGGPIFNSNAELIGINYAGGSSLSSELNDYQDPHASYYNPIVSPGTINVVGVDASGIRDLIDDNSIFFDDHVSSLSAIEKEYFADQSENLFSIENNNDFLSLSKLTDYEFKHIKNIDPNIESNLKWKVLDVLSNEENEFYVINTYIDDYVPGINIVKLDGSLNVDSNFANAGYYNRIFENIETQKVINSKIYNDFLYILTQDNRNQQVSYSIHKIDLINPQNLITVFSSINDINHSSNFFPKDFEVDENGFFILGTTDYAESTVSQGSRSYDFFVSNYTHEGTLNPSFANGGIFQKDYGKTDKASDIVIQPDGKIIISGIKWTDQAPDAIATRLNNNGSVDLTFGNNGTTLISIENQKTSSIDDLGREEANEILIDENGNIYIAGTKYFGKSSRHNDLSASDGGYQSSIWKYDTNGAIVESFGNIDYENGSIPGLSSIEINGENKIQRLMLIGDQIIAIIFTREGISKSTSSKIFKIDKQTGQPEIYAYDKISFFIPKKLEGREDNPIKNVPMKFWLPPNKDYNYSFSSPANGAIVDNNNLSFDYIPNKDYFGIDSFIFELEVDDTIITKTIDIDVKPINDFPAIYGENNIEINEDNNLNLKIYDADGDDDILDYNFLVPENGVIIDQGDLTFTYIPNKDFFGFERLQINVEHVEPLNENEIYNSNISVDINILAVNDPPVVEEGSLTIDEDNLGVLALQGNDVDSNNLTFSIVDTPSNGEVSIEGDDVTYTPAKNFNGEDTFTYKASDGSDDSNLSTITVIVNPINDPPVVEELSLSTTLNTEIFAEFDGSDVDENTLIYKVVVNPKNGSLSIENNTFVYTPDNNYVGQDTFNYKANDGSVDSNEAIIFINIDDVDTDNDGISDRYDNCPDTPDGAVIDVNGCEVFALPIDNFKVEVGSATCIGNNNGTINLSVEDASYNYTVTISGKDSMTISGTSKTTSVTGLAKGTYTVCFRVDGQDNYEQCFEVQVKEPPALSAFMKINGKFLNITMSGSDEYSIDINGNTQKINSNKYETTLSSGLNIIKVYTSLECQGFVQEQVLISEDVYYYPNPTKNNVNIIVGGKDNKVSLSVYTIDGVLIYSREQLLDDISRKTVVDLSKYTSGTYIIVIESESISQTFKIIKE
jgi:S1-C subfamily serine protease